MFSGRPTLVWCDIEQGFINCFATLTTVCSFGVGVWVYSLVSSPFPYIISVCVCVCACVCVCILDKIKKMVLGVVKSSHIGRVWHWEGVNHLLRATNCRMQFWDWWVSVFPLFIPLPLYKCVCVINKWKKRYLVLSSHPTLVRCDIVKGLITCFTTLTSTSSFGVGEWVYSLVLTLFPYIYVCVCVCLTYK